MKLTRSPRACRCFRFGPAYLRPHHPAPPAVLLLLLLRQQLPPGIAQIAWGPGGKPRRMGSHGVGMGLAWGWHGVGMGLAWLGLAWGWHGVAWGWHGVGMGLAWGWKPGLEPVRTPELGRPIGLYWPANWRY
jgi:hypothetical protein